MTPLALREAGDIQSSDGARCLSGQHSGPRSLARGAVQGSETAPWPRGPARQWQSRPHLLPASVPTSSRAQVPSLAQRLAVLDLVLRQLLVTQGPGPGLLRNSRGAGERLVQSPCSQARASRQPQSRQRGLPRPVGLSQEPCRVSEVDRLCVWTLRDHLPPSPTDTLLLASLMICTGVPSSGYPETSPRGPCQPNPREPGCGRGPFPGRELGG